MTKLVFLAMPTRGTVVDNKVKPEVNSFVAYLHDLHQNTAFLCPVIQDYQVLPYLTKGKASWKEWENRCKAKIKVADELWVLKYPEWNCSIGVAEEIEFAITNGIKVVYINV